MAEPFDVNQLLGSLSQFNPVTKIPGMVQQGKQAIDPYIQQLLQMIQQQQAPQVPAPPQQQAPQSLKGRMTGGGGY